MDQKGKSIQEWLSAAVKAGFVDRKVSAGQSLFRAGDKTVGLYEVL